MEQTPTTLTTALYVMNLAVTSEQEILRLKDERAMLREALERWLGPEDDPAAGWHGSGGTSELFACEYCNQKHGDCTKIQHSALCPIPKAREALEATK